MLASRRGSRLSSRGVKSWLPLMVMLDSSRATWPMLVMVTCSRPVSRAGTRSKSTVPGLTLISGRASLVAMGITTSSRLGALDSARMAPESSPSSWGT